MGGADGYAQRKPSVSSPVLAGCETRDAGRRRARAAATMRHDPPRVVRTAGSGAASQQNASKGTSPPCQHAVIVSNGA